MHLWELTTQAELVSVWREADQERYRVKRREVCDTLQVLRDYVHAPEQERQIDTLCLLLQEKEFLLSAVMNTFLQLQETGNFVREKIPVIVSRIERISPQKQTMNAMQSFAASKMKKGLRSIFHRKESRSAYPEQREKVAREKERIPIQSLLPQDCFIHWIKKSWNNSRNSSRGFFYRWTVFIITILY